MNKIDLVGKDEQQTLSRKDRLSLNAMNSPAFRSSLALQEGTSKNILIKTWGGLGDQICAEPAIRYAIEKFKGCEVSLVSEQPSLFSHLKFKRVFNSKEEQPIWEKYFVFDTIHPPTHIQWEFMSHMLINAVDYVSLCAFRCQMPIADRIVKLPSVLIPDSVPLSDQHVYVHAGRHWQSKTFPKHWWDDVLASLKNRDLIPVLIGADTDDNRGTVDVDATDCVDLRNKLSIAQTISALKHAKVLLTNDSSPLHMAVDGDAWIGYVATCKHPDYIAHWRADENGKPSWSWRMENLGLGGIWDIVDYCPNKAQELSAEFVGEENLLSWLPDPRDVADWAEGKSRS